MDPNNHPSVMQWNTYRPVPQPRPNGNETAPDNMFPVISTADQLSNSTLESQQQSRPLLPQQHQMMNVMGPGAVPGARSPVQHMNHNHQQHDFNSPTSTNSSFSQPKHQSFDDYRYSHTTTNWLYGPGAVVQTNHNNTNTNNTHGQFPLQATNQAGLFVDANGHFHGQDSAKPRTETSLTPLSSPSYSSMNDGDSPGVGARARSASTSSKSSTYKDATGKTKRSRMGCLTCRHRKKRCCERRPKCQECERLGLKCTWPVPGLEHRNRPKNAKMNDDMHYDAFYGNIKILREIVEYRINATS